MNNVWRLPASLSIGGAVYPIKTDFRDVLKLIGVLSDPDILPEAKGYVALKFMIENFDELPEEQYENALKQLYEFIDVGEKEESRRKKPALMNWDQDAPLIIPAVNKVLGQEVRAMPYLHWWTFVGAYMNIDGEGLFSSVISIRSKKAKGKKLEKYEQEFYRDNKSLIDIKKKRSNEDQEALNELRRALGFKER